MMRRPEHGDGPRPDVPASSGAVVRTPGVARPVAGASQCTEPVLIDSEARGLAPAYDFLRAIANLAAPVDRAA